MGECVIQDKFAMPKLTLVSLYFIPDKVGADIDWESFVLPFDRPIGHPEPLVIFDEFLGLGPWTVDIL